MPIVKSKYNPPVLFKNYHISTVYASVFRKVPLIEQHRERLELNDGDFLDLDWSYSGEKRSKKVLIILHGLEGNAKRPYVTGLSRHFIRNGWDVAAMNFRSCSGELNRLYRSYNAGASDDLEEVIKHILYKQSYEILSLNGFSLGGNLMLKYLGEEREHPKELKAAVAISTPCDLYLSLKKLEEPQNRFYSRRFVKKLKNQLLLRQEKFPDQIKKKDIIACKSLYEIDDLYTGKAHGFLHAHDYYEKSSSLQFLPDIKVPTLLINARNDHFLSVNSSPIEIAEEHPYLHLEMPQYGGHVGFLQKKKQTYTEERALGFIEKYTP